jgi:hypothetical protein
MAMLGDDGMMKVECLMSWIRSYVTAGVGFVAADTT